ncbi:hypothetical protein GE09DRAFT_1081071 [Coniochaeta sp. 2T2.1]|nr:hypothetical protein GE09DRAFT_1081071 [Coniochaeta sp. 2T2.1]
MPFPLGSMSRWLVPSYSCSGCHAVLLHTCMPFDLDLSHLVISYMPPFNANTTSRPSIQSLCRTSAMHTASAYALTQYSHDSSKTFWSPPEKKHATETPTNKQTERAYGSIDSQGSPVSPGTLGRQVTSSSSSPSSQSSSCGPAISAPRFPQQMCLHDFKVPPVPTCA